MDLLKDKYNLPSPEDGVVGEVSAEMRVAGYQSLQVQLDGNIGNAAYTLMGRINDGAQWVPLFSVRGGRTRLPRIFKIEYELAAIAWRLDVRTTIPVDSINAWVYGSSRA